MFMLRLSSAQAAKPRANTIPFFINRSRRTPPAPGGAPRIVVQ